MKLIFAVILFIRYDPLYGLRSRTEEFWRNAETGTETSYDSEVDNTDVIKGGNNWKTKEIDEISQSRRRENLKRNDPSRMLWNRYQTIPDQFYDYARTSRRYLKGIEGEKIARGNKKLENISVAGDGGGIGVDRRRVRRQFHDGHSIKDLENKNEYRDYQNTSPDNTISWFAKEKYLTISDPTSQNFAMKLEEFKENTQRPYPRLKRQTTQDYNLGIKQDEPDFLDISVPTASEHNSISKMKEEISKLQNLVHILKDQQNILKLLDEISNSTNHSDKIEDVLHQHNRQEDEVSELIDIINNDNTGTESKGYNFNDNYSKKLENDIKILKMNFNQLNDFTRSILLEKIENEITARKNMKTRFEKELNELSSDLVNTKRLIFTILKKFLQQNKSHRVIHESHNVLDNNNNSEFNDILKQLKTLEMNISTIMEGKRSRNINKEIVGGTIDENYSIETSVEDPPSLKSRMNTARNDDEDSNDEMHKLLELLEDNKVSTKNGKKSKWRQLLRELDDSSENDSLEALINDIDDNESHLLNPKEETSEALLPLIKLLSKNKKATQRRNRLLIRLRKLIKGETASEKSEGKEVEELLRKLINKPETKTIDDNVKDDVLIANLKELSDEIEHLRQKDDDESTEMEESRNFQALLKKLVSSEKPIQPQKLTPKPKFTKKQITTLIKQLSTLANINGNIETDKAPEDGFIYKNIPLFGTYKCDKLPKQYLKDLDDNSYKTQYGKNPYDDRHIQWYKPNPPDYYQPSQNSYKLFQDYKNEIPAPPDYFRFFPSYQDREHNFNPTHTQQYSPNSPEDNSYYTNERIEDLIEQVGNLKAVIMNLDRPEYIQKAEDKQTLDNLNIQIDNLRRIISSMENEPNYNSKIDYQLDKPYSNIYANQNHLANIDKSQFQSSGNIRHYPLQSPISLNQTPKEISGTYQSNPNEKMRTKIKSAEIKQDELQINGSKDRGKREVNDVNDLSTLLNRILEDGVDNSKGRVSKSEDLDNEDDSREVSAEDFARAFNQQYSNNKMNKKRTKKLGIFDKFLDKILDKIIDKLQIAIPRMIERLFGLNNFYVNNAYSNYHYGDNIVAIFRNFGIAGYIPLIILKVLYSLSSLIYELQRYPFIKNFLVPGGTIALVSGLMAFLIYWFQPNYYGQGEYLSYQGQSYNSHDQYKNPYYQHSNPYYNGDKYYSQSVDKSYKNQPFGAYKSNYYNDHYTYRSSQNEYANRNNNNKNLAMYY